MWNLKQNGHYGQALVCSTTLGFFEVGKKNKWIKCYEVLWKSQLSLKKLLKKNIYKKKNGDEEK